MVRGSRDTEEVQSFIDGKAFVGHFFNRSFDTIAGPVHVDEWGERPTDSAIAFPVRNGSLQVFCLINNLRSVNLATGCLISGGVCLERKRLKHDDCEELFLERQMAAAKRALLRISS